MGTVSNELKEVATQIDAFSSSLSILKQLVENIQK